MSLPIIRSHERMDFGRCPKKWYWKWRKGLTPRAKTFGPLEFGTWWHEALAKWYGFPLKLRRDPLSLQGEFIAASQLAITLAQHAGAPEHQIDKAQELAALGEDMAHAYVLHYQGDPDIQVIQAEIPLEFEIPDETGKVVAVHRLKPDLVYADRNWGVWLMEHKTAAQIRTEHLVIDGQARPYGVMAEPALRKLGLLSGRHKFEGIMYNFARKALSDERQRDATGKALNKNGTVSARQPAANFVRHPVTLTRAAKRVTLARIQTETILVTTMAQEVRNGEWDPARIPKTPHSSCVKFCDYFSICAAEENGTDISEMTRSLFMQRDPYDYDDQNPTTDEHPTFEMG